ncbi:DUF2917 domain-containing protein [Ideonella sp. BN130291]|uniref:DUF2917 domain-containing protein n=1 Tax=Ideonella sp. BN130291 TaxID=3112940 RepID=UPI002E26C12F|nr:DUF2917 domain-containing protein [Ideonella sp. BN130291]
MDIAWRKGVLGRWSRWAWQALAMGHPELQSSGEGVELRVHLPAGTTMSLVPDGVLALECLAGCAWSTTDRVAKDTILGAGGKETLAPFKRVFIVGMPECELRIARLQP